MNQPIGPTQVHECAKVAQATDNPSSGVPRLEVIQQPLFLLLTPFAHRCSFRKDQAIPLAIQLDDLETKSSALDLLQHLLSLFIAYVPGDVRADDLGCRNKPPDTGQIYNKATPIDICHSLFQICPLVQVLFFKTKTPGINRSFLERLKY